jgi:hypothetical protein
VRLHGIEQLRRDQMTDNPNVVQFKNISVVFRGNTKEFKIRLQRERKSYSAKITVIFFYYFSTGIFAHISDSRVILWVKNGLLF